MSSQRCEHWRAFDEEWFRRHQALLLRLLNGPFRRILRSLLRIDDDRNIISIGPNRYVVPTGKLEAQATFYTHWKFSKRVYFSIRPLWWLLHGWDCLIPNRFRPALGFGFDTLTCYPDPDPETTTVDGEICRSGVDETFSTIRQGQGTYADDSGAGLDLYLTASSSQNQFSDLCRSIFLFDTSALGSSVTISSATLSLYIYSKYNNLGSTSLEIVTSNPASNTALSSSDFQCLGSTSLGSIAYDSISTGCYNAITLNGDGIANINKAGVSKFGARLGWDQTGTFEGTWASNASTTFGMYSSELSGTTMDPKLVVVYTPAPVQKSGSDTGSFSSAEVTTNALASALSDSGSLSVSEAANNLLAMTLADSGALNSAEIASTVVLVLLSAVDSGLISAQEALSLITAVNVSDSGALSGTESSGNALWSALVDAGVLSASDLAQIAAVAGTADLGTLSAQELAVVLQTLLASDSGTISASETAVAIALAILAASDSGTISAVESALCQIYQLPPPTKPGVRVVPWLRPI